MTKPYIIIKDEPQEIWEPGKFEDKIQPWEYAIITNTGDNNE